MYCNNCGKQIKDGSKYCPLCGAEVIDADATVKIQERATRNMVKGDRETKRKKGKGKFIFLAILLLIFVIGIGGVIFVFTSPAHQLSSCIKKEDYDRVDTIYSVKVKDNGLQMLLANKFLTDSVADIMEDYGANKMEYDTAQSGLESISSLDGLDAANLAADRMKTLKTLSESKEAFEKAEKYYESGDYAAAISAYKNVSEQDSENYKAAQSKISSATDSYRNQILEKIGTPTTVDEYKTALGLLETALTVMTDDKTLIQKQSEVQAAYSETVKAIALTDGTEALNNGNYEEAFSLIQDALTQNPDDSELQNLLSSSQDKYETYITDEVGKLVADDDFEGALELISQALSVLPNSTVLSNLQESTENSQPVKLSDLKITESDHYEMVDSLEVNTDTIGNIYNPGNLFRIYGDYGDGYADYYLNKEYTKLTGIIAVSDESDANQGTLTIYGDGDQILYTVDLSRTTEPIKLSLDLNDVKWFEIRYVGDNRFYVLLSDFKLTKK